MRTLAEALERISAKADIAPKGSWLVVAGGWTERQFAEDRRPTQAEIVAAAPDHHVFVQLFYSRVLLTPGGYEALGIARDPGLAAAITVERDAGRAADRLADWRRPRHQRSVRPLAAADLRAEGRRHARVLPRAQSPSASPACSIRAATTCRSPITSRCFEVWREGALTLRVRYSLCAPRRGHELEDFEALTQVLPMGFGDDWLRFNGIGENVTWGMYNNETPTAGA